MMISTAHADGSKASFVAGDPSHEFHQQMKEEDTAVDLQQKITCNSMHGRLMTRSCATSTALARIRRHPNMLLQHFPRFADDTRSFMESMDSVVLCSSRMTLPSNCSESFCVTSFKCILAIFHMLRVAVSSAPGGELACGSRLD